MEQNRIETGELWWVHFPFSESRDIKRRPALVIDNDTIAILSVTTVTRYINIDYTA